MGVISGNIKTSGELSGNITVGAGGTKDYEQLENLPKINNNEVIGNKTSGQLGLASAGDIVNLQNQISGIVGNIDYSTEEQNTGIKWIDGKYIYQKTYHFIEHTEQAQKTYYIIDINVDNIITHKTMYKLGYNGGYGVMIAPFWDSNDYNSSVGLSISPNKLISLSVIVRGWLFSEVWSTIYYTKNED